MKMGKWTIIPIDKRIVKQYGDGKSIGYMINDESFWNSNISSNIHAIQYTGDNADLNQVEHNDNTPHTYFNGDIKLFADKWDQEHLKALQLIWDNDNVLIEDGSTHKLVPGETIEQKINRIGPRPTSYTSVDIY